MAKKILIVEDDLVIRKMYSDLLAKNGYEVFPVATYEECFDVIGKEPIDLVLLDLMLSGTHNGFDILEAIRQDPNRKTVKVIVLTNLDSEEKVAREIGVTDYLVKVNTKPSDVLEKIEKVI